MKVWSQSLQIKALLTKQGSADPYGLPIQQCPCHAFNFFQDCSHFDCLSIRPVRCHRFHNVCHRQDSGFRENRILFKALRIARTIQLLVMLTHDVGNGPRERNISQNLFKNYA
jgi:hypothetical protein